MTAGRVIVTARGEVTEWVIGDPGCPYRFVFRRDPFNPGVVTLKVFDTEANLLLPKPPTGEWQSIGFLPHQQEVFREIFAKPEEK